MTNGAGDWYRRNKFHHSVFPVTRLLEEFRRTQRSPTVSVCLPARNEQRTIGAILERLTPLHRLGLIDQIAVIDGSTDRTPEIASDLGAEVYAEAELMADEGEVLGKGDAMWRAFGVLRGELVCFLDADTDGLRFTFCLRLARSPDRATRRIGFVKGAYRRPFRIGEVTLPDEGGRVTELMARPLLNLFYPDLAGFEQPLAGEFAARRTLLERLPFATGYGVEIGLLIDAYTTMGLSGLAQVDLDLRQNAHQPSSGARTDGGGGAAGGRGPARARGPPQRPAAREPARCRAPAASRADGRGRWSGRRWRAVRSAA